MNFKWTLISSAWEDRTREHNARIKIHSSNALIMWLIRQIASGFALRLLCEKYVWIPDPLTQNLYTFFERKKRMKQNNYTRRDSNSNPDLSEYSIANWRMRVRVSIMAVIKFSELISIFTSLKVSCAEKCKKKRVICIVCPIPLQNQVFQLRNQNLLLTCVSKMNFRDSQKPYLKVKFSFSKLDSIHTGDTGS